MFIMSLTAQHISNTVKCHLGYLLKIKDTKQKGLVGHVFTPVHRDLHV